MDCVQRAQTSAKASNLNQWSGIRIQIFGLIRKFRIWIRMSAGSRASCCGSITFRRQSFRRVSWKSASDCMRNANKSPKVPYSGCGKWKMTRNPCPGPDHHQQFFRLVGLIIAPSFNEVGWLLLHLILYTHVLRLGCGDKTTDRTKWARENR